MCVIILLAACSAESKTGPETGMVHVTLATTGQNLDPDGYSLLVNGRPQGHVADQVDTTLLGIPAGSGSVSLSGVAGNCAPQPSLPRTVSVPADDTVSVAVTIQCAATNGFLRLALQVGGYDLDPDGFVAAVDGGAGIAVGAQGKVLAVGAGDHSVTLGGLASNCGLTALPATQAFHVEAGDTAEVDYLIACMAITGSIQVTTSTTGARPDPDGYLVSVGNGTQVLMGINDTHLFAGLAPGSYQVHMTAIAANCTQYLPDQVTAVVEASGYPLEITLPVDCPEVGTLRVETPIIPQVASGYAIFVGDASYAIGASDTTVITNIPVGTHSFSIRIVEGGCVASPSAGTVTILANQVTDLRIDCPAVGTLRIETPVVPGAGTNFAILVGTSWYLLGATDTTVVPSVLAGAYSFSVAVPAGCTATPESGTLTINPYAVTDLKVDLTCPATLSVLHSAVPGVTRAPAVRVVRRSDQGRTPNTQGVSERTIPRDWRQD